MDLTTSFINNGIRASAHYTHDVADILFDSYDVVIVSSSWDYRCLNLTHSLLQKVPFGVLFLFDDKDKMGHRDKHDSLLKSWMTSITTSCTILNGCSTDVSSVFTKLFTILTSISLQYERPISVLFDLSTCPRYISLSTLSKGFNLGIMKRVDYFYGECLYPDPVGGILGGVEEVMFTSGEWKTLPLEHCLGHFSPSSKGLFIVSIGFEGNKILRVLNIEDPDSVKVLMPDPGYSQVYVNRVLQANSELIREYQVDLHAILRANAGDAVAAWQALDMHLQCAPDNNLNHSYLCTGSKPHSLGMTLSAMSNENVAVLYTLPKEHNFVEVHPLPNYWVYQVDNLTVPTIRQS